MRPPSKTLWAIVYAAAFAAAMIAATQPAEAQPLDYDPHLAMERESFLRLYVATARCMRGAAISVLRNGERDRETVLGFMQQVCGGPLKTRLTGFEGFTTAQADGLIQYLTEQALDAQLR